MSEMTREEARKWIQYHINISDYEETDELYIALNMAMSSLSTPEKEKGAEPVLYEIDMDGYDNYYAETTDERCIGFRRISSKDLYRLVCLITEKYNEHNLAVVFRFYCGLKEEKSIHDRDEYISEREKGEWILKCEFPRRWECSCCHTSSYEPLDRCPKCEADMRGNK